MSFFEEDMAWQMDLINDEACDRWDERERLALEEHVWLQAKGEQISIDEMTIIHLQNARQVCEDQGFDDIVIVFDKAIADYYGGLI